MSLSQIDLIDQLDQLIAKLAQAAVPTTVTNQYAIDGPPGNAIRRANLRLALRLALEAQPTLLLIGEAPGYNGALRTGVPFTSEQVLLEGIEPPGLFGKQRGFAQATDDGRVSREQTATLVWREVQALGCYIVGWNAFPFHPHQPDRLQSNRTPRMTELHQGQPFLQQFCALFPRVPLVAMGRSAERALTLVGVAHSAVRHPAQGGARLFADGLRRIYNGINR